MVEANPAWQHLLGWSHEQVVGTQWCERVHDDQRSAAERAMTKELQRLGSVSGFEARYRAADGSYRWMLWGADMADGWGFAVGRDISARRLAHVALRRARERAEAMGAALHAGLVVVSPDLEIVEANDRFCEMVGYDRDAIIGLRPPHPWWPLEDRDAILAMAGDLARLTGRRARFVRSDGRRFEIRGDVAALPDEDGAGRTLLVIHDLSELLAAEDAPGLEPAGGT
ncbi:PAS domain S-box protein [Svornostia abyssi]|uniref:PAS domain S-box protein n=1 Tax=Svornostia abyssi TaxID=2898438 RepID=A0ABY5PNJ0_9ACTN|nr:PAS domain S-box protein [Parviterribacteraceae bacterium J379]